MLKTKRCEGVLSRAGGAVEAKRDHTGVFCCIDDAAATVHSPALRCIRPCWHTCSPGGRTIGIWGFGPMEARGLTGRARPLYSAGFATSPSGRCPISPCGGIGRRARLKIEFRKECWFDSGQGHHPPSLKLRRTTTLRVADVRQRRARSTQHHFKASESGRTVAQICGFQIFRDRVGVRLSPGKWERQQARPHYRRLKSGKIARR